MLVLFNMKQQFYCLSIIFTCPDYWKSQGISHGLESGHPGFTDVIAGNTTGINHGISILLLQRRKSPWNPLF
jgi:hypothetical protein